MEKSTTLNLRVNPIVKEKAEAVLNQLGIPMSTAITIYLNQISLTGGIPFSVSLPQASSRVNADLMSEKELLHKLEVGHQDFLNGNVKDAETSLLKFED